MPVPSVVSVVFFHPSIPSIFVRNVCVCVHTLRKAQQSLRRTVSFSCALLCSPPSSPPVLVCQRRVLLPRKWEKEKAIGRRETLYILTLTFGYVNEKTQNSWFFEPSIRQNDYSDRHPEVETKQLVSIIGVGQPNFIAIETIFSAPSYHFYQ